MRFIFWGLFFLFFNLNIDAIGFNILPEFVGWILISAGCIKLGRKSEHFRKAVPFAIILAAVETYVFVINFFNTGELLETVNFILALVLMVLQGFAVYRMIKGTAELEKNKKCNLNSAAIRRFWILQIVFNYGAFFLTYVNITASLVCTLASYIFGIILLVYWDKNCRTYKA